MKIFLMLLLNGVVFFVCLGADYTNELAQVKSGERKEARTEWWGYDPKDSTENLQAALDSGVKKLTISKQSGPWLVKSTLKLPSDMEIVFEDGAEIKAMRGYFKGIVDCLLKARSRKNLTLRGKGIITMRKADYMDPDKYKYGGGHRHTLGLFSCDNIKIEGLTLQQSGGDGIYVNNIKKLLIENVTLDEHYRQGISVISGKNILIKNCIIKNTNGTAPQCGIDFEPNNAHEQLTNCRVENCRFENNAASGININTTNLVSKDSSPVDIVVDNCVFIGGKYGISFMQMQREGEESTAKGKVIYRNCQIKSPSFSALHLDSIRSTGPSITLENVIVSQTTSAVAPIYFYLREFLNENAGNINFLNCKFTAPKAVEILDCTNYSSGALEKVTGNVLFNDTKVELSDFISKKEFNLKPPTLKIKKINPKTLHPGGFKDLFLGNKSLLRLRGKTEILLYAQKDIEIAFCLEYFRMGRYKTPSLKLILQAPDGKQVSLNELVYKLNQPQEFRFIPDQSGAYILKIPNHTNCVLMRKCSVPWGIFSRPKSTLCNLVAPHGAIFFVIPAGVTFFNIEVAGRGSTETVNAEVEIDGKIVASAKDISRSKYFHINIQADSKPRMGILTFRKVKGNVFVLFPAPLLPIYTNSPENVFIEK